MAVIGPYVRDINGGWIVAGALAQNVNAGPTTALVWWDLSALPGGSQRTRGASPTSVGITVNGTFSLTYEVLFSSEDAAPATTPCGATNPLPWPVVLTDTKPNSAYLPTFARFVAFNVSAYVSGAANCWINGVLVASGSL